MRTNPTVNHLLLLLAVFIASCTSQKKLAYLDNLPELDGEETFTMVIPDYKIQPRDVLYITVKAMTPDGRITDFLSSTSSYLSSSNSQNDATGYLYGFDVNRDGDINIPVVGKLRVAGLTLEETKKLLQEATDKVFKNSTVECKLLSFKYTVIGEVRAPGTFINYNNYLTVLEAIGRAGGIGDYGNRSKVLVIRPVENGTRTYRLNLQDKNLLNSEAYFLLPNDVIIVEPLKQKIFNLNLPVFSFILTTSLSAVSTTLLLINYFNK